MKDRKKPAIRFKGFTEDWEQRKVNEICSISTGKSNTQDKIDDGKYPFYVRSPIIERSNRYLYDEEAVLTVGDGVGTGKVFHYVNGKYDIHQRVYRLFDFSDDIDAKFFYHWFSENFYNRVMYMTAKTSVDSVRLEMIADMEITAPSYDEQKKISSYLDNFDNLITLHQRKYDKLVNVKKSMLEKMFPRDGKIVPDIRFSGFTEDWEQRKLGEVVDVCSGRDYKHLSEGDIPVYGTGGYMLSVNQALSYDEDAIGIGRKGTIDKPYVLKSPFWTVDTLFYAVPRDKIALNFAFDIFQNIDWKKKDESTGVPSLSKTAINEIDVLIPKYEEQHALGQFFNDIDNLITLHQCKCNYLLRLKDCIFSFIVKTTWEQRMVSQLFKVTRGYVLAATQTETEKTDEKPYPVYSSQTKDKGLMGYYKDYLYEDAITWTTDGANAGTVNYRAGKFYCTNVCGVLLSNEVKANQMIAEALNNIAKRYVSYVGNPKLMNNVMADIVIQMPIQVEEREQLSLFFTNIDNLITLHQRKLEKLKNIKKSCLEKMFI